MTMVAAEIGDSAQGLSLGGARVRTLAGKASGPVSFADLRGKSWYVPMTVTLNDVVSEFNSDGIGGNAQVAQTCQVSGGSGGYTFQFNQVSNPVPLNVSTINGGQTLVLQRAYGRDTNFVWDATFSCSVTDNTGHTVVSRTALLRIVVSDDGA